MKYVKTKYYYTTLLYSYSSSTLELSSKGNGIMSKQEERSPAGARRGRRWPSLGASTILLLPALSLPLRILNRARGEYLCPSAYESNARSCAAHPPSPCAARSACATDDVQQRSSDFRRLC